MRKPFALLLVLFVILAVADISQPRPVRAADCNAAPREPVSQVPLSGHPFSAVLSPDGCWVFVSISSSNPRSPNGVALLRRDGGILTLVRTVSVENGPTKMVMTHDGKLLIGADDDYVVFLDVDRLEDGDPNPILGYLSDGDGPGTVWVNVTKDDKFIFASDEGAASITVIDLVKARATNFDRSAIVGQIPVDNSPVALTFSPDERWLYTTSQVARKKYKAPAECKVEGDTSPTAAPVDPQGVLIVVDVNKAKTDPEHAAVGRAPAGCHPVRLALTPDGRTAWVSARGSDAVLAFDTRTLIADPRLARIATVPVGRGPVGIDVVRGGKYVVVGNANRYAADQNAARTLSVINTAKALAHQPADAGTIPSGSFPREIIQSRDGRTLFVSNFNSDTLEIIDVDRLALH